MLRLLLLSFVFSLNACSAIHTSIKKGELDVQMRMSQTIYLDPVDPELRTVFLDIRQTAAEYQQPLMQDVALLLTERGYRLVSAPSEAQYWLQVNIRTVINQAPHQVLREQYAMTEQEIHAFLHPGMAPPEPAPLRQRSTSNTIIASNVHFDSEIRTKDVVRAIAIVAAIAGTEYIGNQMVKDNYYTLIADIQVAERLDPLAQTQVFEQSQHILLQGDSGQLEQMWEAVTDRRKYQVRLLGFANKANLTWQEAEPSLHMGLMRSLAGIF